MRAASMARSVLAGVCLVLLLALPAPATLENGVEDLPGTTWNLKGSLTTTASAQGRSAAGTEKSGPMVLEFLELRTIRCESKRYGTITGIYTPTPGSTRKAQGELDVESLGPALRRVERQVERRASRMVGGRVGVSLNVRSTSLKAKLNRAGSRLRVKAKVKISGRVSAGRGSARLRGAFRFRLSGTQPTE
jgi:hypothetical protein